MTSDPGADGEIGTPPDPETAPVGSTVSAEPGVSSLPDQDVSGLVLAEVRALSALISERLGYDVTKEEAFQRLYADLEHYRSLTNPQFFRPLYLDLILLLDRLGAGLDALAPDSGGRGLLESVQAELEEVLARRGVEQMPVAVFEFDAQRQRAVEVIATDDPGQHLTVASVIRPGYENDGAVVRAADVVVRRFATPTGEVP